MTAPDTLRYARQIRLPEVGIEGQAHLSEASVLVVGAGGLGAPVLHHLAASGVGRIGIVEFDALESQGVRDGGHHVEGCIFAYGSERT